MSIADQLEIHAGQQLKHALSKRRPGCGPALSSCLLCTKQRTWIIVGNLRYQRQSEPPHQETTHLAF